MSVFLDACRRKPTPFTPIWLMRQAGRYQPEYRAIREKVGFVELCKSPELACEVTVRAVEQLGVDAGIIFADILLILDPLGIPFEFTPNMGPRILKPLKRGADVDRVATEIHPEESLSFVMEAIRLTKAELGETPLIGFAGAPFTLASYAIEGAGSRNYIDTKKLMYGDDGAWHALMVRFSDAIARYLKAQIRAGADAVQLFDSWAGCLSEHDYRRFVLPYSQRVIEDIGGEVPVIHFAQGNPALYPAVREAGGDVISIDWRSDLGQTWSKLGEVAIQGNLDPVALLGPRAEMEARAARVLAEAGERPGHIFNLGHGVFKWTEVDQARALVDFVHEHSSR